MSGLLRGSWPPRASPTRCRSAPFRVVDWRALTCKKVQVLKDQALGPQLTSALGFDMDFCIFFLRMIVKLTSGYVSLCYQSYAYNPKTAIMGKFWYGHREQPIVHPAGTESIRIVINVSAVRRRCRRTCVSVPTGSQIALAFRT